MEKDKKDVEKIIEFPDNFSIGIITTKVDEDLIRYFSEHPEEMKTMNRRLFEEMIAELFSGFGYEVELTKQTRDGGIDIIAIKNLEVSVKYIIQATRPEPGNPVRIKPVRALYGVKHREKATKAILATTTYFTKDAKMEFRDLVWELELKEYEGILGWINTYLKIRGK
jgi:HJR/Mrr/RecB family endonuclease